MDKNTGTESKIQAATSTGARPPDGYGNLVPARIVETAQQLSQRISERFPGSGLSKVSGELLSVSREAASLSNWLAQPILWIRLLVLAGIVLLACTLVAALAAVNWRMSAFSSLAEFFQGLEAAVNDLVFMGVAVYFLVTWETRRKRRRALRAVHVLRSLAHIIDMHQLTKDPERIMNAGPSTGSSPQRAMNAFELTRYLDYCSELLSLISKIGAVYVESYDDPVTLSAVNDVETLTSGLARKIWQKIMILDRIISPAPGAEEPSSHTARL